VLGRVIAVLWVAFVVTVSLLVFGGAIFAPIGLVIAAVLAFRPTSWAGLVASLGFTGFWAVYAVAGFSSNTMAHLVAPIATIAVTASAITATSVVALYRRRSVSGCGTGHRASTAVTRATRGGPPKIETTLIRSPDP